jgi:DNA-binding HxlR family transcriptional regulator
VSVHGSDSGTAGRSANLGRSVDAMPSTAGDGRDAVRVCPHFHAAVELIGKRWAGAILWALCERPHYFGELSLAIPGLSDRLLSRRLRELESEGLVERSVHAGSPARVSYALTDKGEALAPAIHKLDEWAQRWNGAGVPRA